jgi:protein Tex
MTKEQIAIISKELSISEKQIVATVKLLEEGGTIPFISRYRKELTGSLDEVRIASIQSLLQKLVELDKRKETVLHTIQEQGKLTDALKKKILSTFDMNELEDIYLPFKPKRKTKASVAREKGLSPLADLILAQSKIDLLEMAKKYISATKGVHTLEEALQGARDILAETISEDPKIRTISRAHYKKSASLKCGVVKGKEEEGIKYKDYFAFEEPLEKCPSHRYLAIMRGVSEGVLKVSIAPEPELCISEIQSTVVQKNSPKELKEQLQLAIQDGYKRLLQPSMETEFRNTTKEKADSEAISVFSKNLRQLLLASPLGQKRILGLDPGFRTGCKLVCIDAEGNLLYNTAIYPHPPQIDTKGSEKIIRDLVTKYKIQAFAIGNGTASRETEAFIRAISFSNPIEIFMVNESGASIYSASEIAREEFPAHDVTVRGAVSIARRLMDPLAELVKIDPKSIGVGQYQHDVDQSKLQTSLDRVVESCVNTVGVNLNTASKHLLSYVSGLGPALAENIVKYRKEKGKFTSRKQLLKVSRLGEKAFEQCAGFLRIPDSENPLDNSAVHPEAYPLVEKMAKDLKTSVHSLLQTESLRKQIQIQKYVSDEIGLPTLKDILEELAKPGRDPRDTAKSIQFDANIRTIEDLKEGMILSGVVNNLTNFGAFVDIGIKESGLVHISQISNRFIKSPEEVLQLNQEVRVKVVSVDLERKRIQLSMNQI